MPRKEKLYVYCFHQTKELERATMPVMAELIEDKYPKATIKWRGKTFDVSRPACSTVPFTEKRKREILKDYPEQSPYKETPRKATAKKATAKKATAKKATAKKATGNKYSGFF